MALTGLLGTSSSRPGDIQLGNPGSGAAGGGGTTVVPDAIATAASVYAPTVVTRLQVVPDAIPSAAHVWPPFIGARSVGPIAHPDNTLVLDMGSGTTPPAGWSNVTFDDSTWAVPRNDTVYGPDWITIPGYPLTDNHAVFRWHCLIEAGAGELITLITGEAHANDDVLEFFINGVAVPALTEATGTAGPVLTADVTSLLHPGDNLVAFHTRNTTGANYSDYTSHAKMTCTVTSPVLWKGPGTWFLLHSTDPYVYWGSSAFQSDSAAGQLVYWDPHQVFTEVPT